MVNYSLKIEFTISLRDGFAILQDLLPDLNTYSYWGSACVEYLHYPLWQFHGEKSALSWWTAVPVCTSLELITAASPTSPCWYFQQCPLFNNALHKPLRKTAANFGWLPWGLTPFPSPNPWKGKCFTAYLLRCALAWAARKSVVVS